MTKATRADFQARLNQVQEIICDIVEDLEDEATCTQPKSDTW